MRKKIKHIRSAAKIARKQTGARARERKEKHVPHLSAEEYMKKR